MSARCPERGAATVLVVAMAGVLLMVGIAAAAVGGLVVAQRRAQSAADLAALAAAGAISGGAGAACTVAAEVAVANGATVIRCEVVTPDVLVEVTVPGVRWQGPAVALTATSRAGPSRPGV